MNNRKFAKKTAVRNLSNPWASRWIEINGEARGIEAQCLAYEARQSEAEPTYPCDKTVDGVQCDGTCYHRPAVGGWWCAKCRQLLFA